MRKKAKLGTEWQKIFQMWEAEKIGFHITYMHSNLQPKFDLDNRQKK